MKEERKEWRGEARRKGGGGKEGGGGEGVRGRQGGREGTCSKNIPGNPGMILEGVCYHESWKQHWNVSSSLGTCAQLAVLGKLEQTVAKYPGYWERWVAAASCRVASNCFCITKWTCRGMVVPDRSCVVETNVSSPLARARYCHRCRPRSQAVWGPPGVFACCKCRYVLEISTCLYWREIPWIVPATPGISLYRYSYCTCAGMCSTSVSLDGNPLTFYKHQ